MNWDEIISKSERMNTNKFFSFLFFFKCDVFHSNLKRFRKARIRPRIKLKIKELERRENRGFETDFHF